jgi:hypothetical protein
VLGKEEEATSERQRTRILQLPISPAASQRTARQCESVFRVHFETLNAVRRASQVCDFWIRKQRIRRPISAYGPCARRNIRAARCSIAPQTWRRRQRTRQECRRAIRGMGERTLAGATECEQYRRFVVERNCCKNCYNCRSSNGTECDQLQHVSHLIGAGRVKRRKSNVLLKRIYSSTLQRRKIVRMFIRHQRPME